MGGCNLHQSNGLRRALSPGGTNESNLQSASTVLVWLGPHRDDSEIALKVIEELAQPLLHKTLGQINPNGYLDLSAIKPIRRLLYRQYWRRVWILQEVSDDISSNSLPTRLVSVAALLRRYSPSPHPLLRLLGHVPALPSINQPWFRLLFCTAGRKLLPLHDYIQRTKSAPMEPKQEPPLPWKTILKSLKADSFRNMALSHIISQICALGQMA